MKTRPGQIVRPELFVYGFENDMPVCMLMDRTDLVNGECGRVGKRVQIAVQELVCKATPRLFDGCSQLSDTHAPRNGASSEPASGYDNQRLADAN